MSAAVTAAPPRAEHHGALATYRDDGPLARALGLAFARITAGAMGSDPMSRGDSRGLTPNLSRGRARGLTPEPELALVLVAVVPLLALIAFGGDSVSEPVAGAAIAWMVLWGGIASGAPLGGNLRWALLPILRASEYGGLLWLAALAGSDAFPAAFALLAALAFRHYDLVYRMRLRGTPPPPWVGNLSLGWDGRLIGGYLLLVLGALPAGFFVVAAVFGVAFVADAVSVWVGGGRSEPGELDDEEDEEE
jgi:hypothetical protein